MKTIFIISSIVIGILGQDDGRYYPTNEGQYVPDNSGAYSGDNGQYHHDDSGAYRHVGDGNVQIQITQTYSQNRNVPSVGAAYNRQSSGAAFSQTGGFGSSQTGTYRQSGAFASGNRGAAVVSVQPAQYYTGGIISNEGRGTLISGTTSSTSAQSGFGSSQTGSYRSGFASGNNRDSNVVVSVQPSRYSTGAIISNEVRGTLIETTSSTSAQPGNSGGTNSNVAISTVNNSGIVHPSVDINNTGTKTTETSAGSGYSSNANNDNLFVNNAAYRSGSTGHYQGGKVTNLLIAVNPTQTQTSSNFIRTNSITQSIGNRNAITNTDSGLAIGFGSGAALSKSSTSGSYQSYGSGYGNNNNYAILRKVENVDPNGYYYTYQTENQITGEEQGKLDNEGTDNEVLRSNGYYEYTGPDNVVYRVEYTANEDGFVPNGAHLPTPPPIPKEILRSLEYLRSAGKL